jgi:hypothetical protein
MRAARLSAIFAGLVAFAVYRRMLLPGVGLWDTAEFQTVPHVLGIMHATGYPLYPLVGKLFTLLPIGAVAYELNLFSALCGAAAASLTVLVAQRLGAGPGPACAAGLALAFSPPLWETALRADPHTLHAAFVPALLLGVLAWREAATPRRLALLGLGVGLALSNHMQTTMLLPALAVGVLWGRWQALSPRVLAAGAGGLAAGLLPYLYLPLRARQHPVLEYGRPEDWERFRALVLGEHFHQDMGLLSLKGFETFLVQAGRLPELLGAWLTGVGALALGLGAVAGLILAWRRDPGVAAMLALAVAAPLYWACTWINGDANRYFIAPLLACWLLVALALEKLPKPVGWLAALAPLALVPLHFAHLDRSADHAGERYASAVLERLPPRAAVFTVWVNATPLWYARHVEGRRPDVRVVDDSEVLLDHHGDLAAAIEVVRADRPVFVLHPAPDADWVRARFKTANHETVAPFGYPLVEVLGK